MRLGEHFYSQHKQSTLRPTKCKTVECLRMLSITTLQATIMTLQLFSKFVMTLQYYEYN